MGAPLSIRLRELVDALPLAPGMRVLEIGCGPGAAARAIAERVSPGGYVLAIDRSDRAIAQARVASATDIAAERLTFRQADVEDFELGAGEEPYDIAFAARVGVLDGRHPAREQDALRAIARALVPRGRLFLDGGTPLREVELPRD